MVPQICLKKCTFSKTEYVDLCWIDITDVHGYSSEGLVFSVQWIWLTFCLSSTAAMEDQCSYCRVKEVVRTICFLIMLLKSHRVRRALCVNAGTFTFDANVILSFHSKCNFVSPLFLFRWRRRQRKNMCMRVPWSGGHISWLDSGPTPCLKTPLSNSSALLMASPCLSWNGW